MPRPWRSAFWRAFDGPIRIAEQELDIGASLGFSLYPDDGQTAERLVRNADVALYRAKAAGRGRFEGYEPRDGPGAAGQPGPAA